MNHSSSGVQNKRNYFMKGGCKDFDDYYSTWEGYRDTTLNPRTADWSSTAAQVAGFHLLIKNNGNRTATYTIINEAGSESFFGGRYTGIQNRTSSTGSRRTITQTFQWTERTECGMGASGGCH